MLDKVVAAAVVKGLTLPRPVRCAECGLPLSLGEVVGFTTESEKVSTPYEDGNYLVCARCLVTQKDRHKVLAFLTFLREGE